MKGVGGLALEIDSCYFELLQGLAHSWTRIDRSALRDGVSACEHEELVRQWAPRRELHLSQREEGGGHRWW